jgi:hypothetical protein
MQRRFQSKQQLFGTKSSEVADSRSAGQEITRFFIS